MDLKRKILLVSLLLSIGCVGCSRTTLHPILKSDIFFVPKGTQVDDVTTEKDGWFLSEYYIERVAETKISQ